MRRRRRKSQINSNLKVVLTTMSTLFFITIMGFYLFNLYINIDISKEDEAGNGEYSVQRISQTVAEINNESMQVADVIENVSTTVVGISKLRDNGSSIFLENGTESLGLGTGIIVSSDGYILTNEHVSGAKYSSCYVTLENGKSYQANVVWSDSDLDLSVIKINVNGLNYAKLGDSDDIRVGEKVYAIGNPIGYEFQRTVTSGIISAVDRSIKIIEEDKSSYMEDLIQTDATINPGNSGGPLITPSGEVIGINSIKIESAEAIGFAIPINIVKPIIQSYQTTGEFEEASLGVFAYDKNVIPYLDSSLNLENGIYVVDVIKNGSADKVGIKEKDIITKIDGIALSKMSELREYIYTKKPGDNVTLTINRKGIVAPVNIILGKK